MGIPARTFNLVAIFCAATLLFGCTFNTKAADDAAVPPAKVKAADGATDKAGDGSAKKIADAKAKLPPENPCLWSSKSGAELWARDCRQCHNVRSPATLSSAEWENALAHMRFRCNLTAKEFRKISALLTGH